MSMLDRLVAADIAIMRALGGKPGETMSAAAWNAHRTDTWWGWTYLLIDLLFYPLEKDHCMTAWLFELKEQ